MLDELRHQTSGIMTELLEQADLKIGQILVVGCSTSEIGSRRIGTGSNTEIGQAVFETIWSMLNQEESIWRHSAVNI